MGNGQSICENKWYYEIYKISKIVRHGGRRKTTLMKKTIFFFLSLCCYFFGFFPTFFCSLVSLRLYIYSLRKVTTHGRNGDWMVERYKGRKKNFAKRETNKKANRPRRINRIKWIKWRERERLQRRDQKMKTLKNNNVRYLLKTIIRWTAVISLQDLVVVAIVLLRSIYFSDFFCPSLHITTSTLYPSAKYDYYYIVFGFPFIKCCAGCYLSVTFLFRFVFYLHLAHNWASVDHILVIQTRKHHWHAPPQTYFELRRIKIKLMQIPRIVVRAPTACRQTHEKHFFWDISLVLFFHFLHGFRQIAHDKPHKLFIHRIRIKSYEQLRVQHKLSKSWQ